MDKDFESLSLKVVFQNPGRDKEEDTRLVIKQNGKFEFFRPLDPQIPVCLTNSIVEYCLHNSKLLEIYLGSDCDIQELTK